MGVYAVSGINGEIEQTFARSSKVTLVSDCPPGEEPPEVRLAADELRPDDLAPLREGVPGRNSDGLIVWLRGDRLLQGSRTTIRYDALVPHSRTFVPVHLPCLTELDLIGLQPRAMTANPQVDLVDGGFRIAGAVSLSSRALQALNENPEPWSRLCLALLAEQGVAGTGFDSLHEMHRRQDLHPSIRALALRNLGVLLLRYGQAVKAEELLKAGIESYPDYAELRYIMALCRAGQRRYDEALALVQSLKQHANPVYAGSGGETSYRANYLLGTLAEQVGKQNVAFASYLSGLKTHPAYEPSVLGFLRLRLPNELVGQVRMVLFSLVQRELKYLDPVFYFLLLHRQAAAARRLLNAVKIDDARREVMARRLDEADHSYRATPRLAATKRGVVLTGPFLMVSSVARINRAIAKALVDASDLDIALEPHGYATVRLEGLSEHQPVAAALTRQVRNLDLTIRHHWPPRFDRPSHGKLAMIIPWEFGAVPLKWVEQIGRNVDELWVPSRFVRDVFVAGGVNPERVAVIPNGLDADLFTPAGETWRPQGARRFMFLYVGGAIERKGVDVLVEAYRQAFSRHDDASLIIKEIGSSTFYRHNTLTARLQELAHDPTGPHLMVLDQEMSDATLAALYRGCNILVLPYRGEGFGMPLAEAMACGKPVLTTGAGPSRDFCTEDTAYFVQARTVPVRGEPPPFGPLSGPYTWFEPDAEALATRMRHVYEHAEEAARRGEIAAPKIRASHNWSSVTAMYLERIRRLLQL